MPWHIEQRDGRFCVIKDDDGKNQGCHDSREEALAQMRALYAQEPSAKAVIAPGVALAADVAEDGRQWIEVMPEGERFRNGPHYFTITRADLETYAESIRQRGDAISIDRDHETESGGSSRAAGWYTGNAEVRDGPDGARLWAEVQWTKSGRDDVANREFRFVSPVFNFHERDPKSGLWTKAKEILRTTLTNNPFFTQLAPVAQKHPHLTEATVDALNNLADALRAEADQTKEEPVSETAPEPAPPAPEPEATPPEPPKPEGVKMDRSILAMLELPEHADDATVKAAIAAKDEELEKLNAQVASLSQRAADATKLAERVTELEARDRNREIDSILKDEVRAGRVFPGEVDALAETFAHDPTALKALVNSRPPGMFARLESKGSGGIGLLTDPSLRRVAKDMGGKDPLDEDSARAHLAAEQLLASKGKLPGQYTQEEYVWALSEVETQGLVA